MPRIISNNLGKFLIALVLISVFTVGFLFFKNLSAQAQEQIKILPESFEGNWQNAEAAFSQDLSSEATLEEFNAENSAYPLKFLEAVLPEIPEDEIVVPPEPTEEIITSTEGIIEAMATSTATTTISSTTTNATTTFKKSSFFAKLWRGIRSLFDSEVRAESSVCRNGSNQPCGSEIGACQIGVQICQNGVWGQCLGAKMPSLEICDKVDNDCDGQTDEGAICGEGGSSSLTCEQGSNRPCGSEIGACQIGVQICENGAWGQCIGGKTPAQEICDGVDNDCDGQADEDEICTNPKKTQKVLTLTGFGITPPQNTQIKLAQLRLSLAGKGEVGDKLTIDYFYQNIWQNLAVFDLENEISNALNGGYFLYGLPIFENWGDLNDLKIRFTYSSNEQKTGNREQVFLDAVWLEVETEESTGVALVQISEPRQISEGRKFILKSSKKGWKSDEEPEFEITEAPKGFLEKITSLFQKKEKTVVLLSPRSGKELPGTVTIQGNKIKITKPDQEKFRPGVYKLRIKIKEGGEEFIQEQEFAWGVLTINTNKSIYLPNETAYLQMAALRDSGHTICNANLKLEITPPNNGSPTSLNVEQSGKCFANNVTDVPDYFAYYQVEGAGEYQMVLTNLDNGYQIADFFEVRERVPFEIERIGPTRIYPPASYPVTLSIMSEQDFKGVIEERVPATFEIFQPVYSKKYDSISEEGDTKLIKWEVSLAAGESIQLGYRFDAPNIWPYIFLLGPLKIGDFQEIRQWQIASDAVTVITNTGLTTWDVPEDWNDGDNYVEVIGGGGGAGDGSNEGPGGGGGGAYAKTSSINLTPKALIGIKVGAGGAGATANGDGGNGGDTWFGAAASTSAPVVADGGYGSPGNSQGTFGAGGNLTDTVGSAAEFAGGAGAIGHANDTGGGGGGAAGPNGAGGAGGPGGAGGGGGGGGGGKGTDSNGVAGTDTVGGRGGNDYLGNGCGRGGVSLMGGWATTTGGGGGGGDAELRGGNGNTTSTSGGEWGTGYGSGGGGGGGGTGAGTGGNAGGYGGGGGGGEANGGSGRQGIIVVTYTPVDLITYASTTGTQNTPIEVNTTDNYLGGAFTLVRNQGDASTTNIRITEYGTVDATNLTNIELFYEYDTSAPYDCVGLTYDLGTDPQFGNTSTTFSGADGYAEFTSSTAYVTDTRALCLYMEVDVGAGAAADETIDIKINAAGDVTVDDGSVTLTAGAISGQSTLQAVVNDPPSITWETGFHNGVDISIPEWAEGAGKNYYQASTTFKVQDDNGWTNISTTTLFVYRSNIAGNCSTTDDLNINYCYPSTSTSPWNPTTGNTGSICARTNTTADSATFWCTTTLYYVAEPTDAFALVPNYSDQIWKVYASTSDLSWAQGGKYGNGDAGDVEVATNKALEIDSATINYSSLGGNLSSGANTGYNWATTTATTTGNIVVDVHFYGGHLVSSGQTSIPAYMQKFTTSTGPMTYADITTQLPTSTDFAGFGGETHDLTMAKPTTTSPGVTTADKIYWGIGIPSGQAAGTYASSTVLIATSTVANP